MKLQRREYGHYEAITEVEIDEKMFDYVIAELKKEVEDFEETYVFTLEDLEMIAAGKTTRYEEIYPSDSYSSLYDLIFDTIYDYVNQYGETSIIDQQISDWEFTTIG